MADALKGEELVRWEGDEYGTPNRLDLARRLKGLSDEDAAALLQEWLVEAFTYGCEVTY